ncbi:hypothetical protein KPL70_013963 [Citrus sinensis]|nr:hypothetical protein KPL70_013963 [Citrus sinensis]
MDKRWVYFSRHSDEYRKGARDFVNSARANSGKDPTYNTWVLHGENSTYSGMSMQYGDIEMTETYQMYRDQVYFQEPNVSEHTHESSKVEFTNLIKDAETPLYPGCTKHTKISTTVSLFKHKVTHGISDKGFDELLQIVRDILPSENTLPESLYSTKNLLKTFDLGYEKIHACINDCCLFRKELGNAHMCPKCGASRWKVNERTEKIQQGVPAKVLRYFPIIPRLKRMFSVTDMAEQLRWHQTHKSQDGKMRHPVDSLAWDIINKKWPSFASDSRNIRFGLATDGFNPFQDLSTRYSCWPVILVIYNLPPWLCMSKDSLMLSLLIPGPKQPGNDIDVYLAPLVEDLKELWINGVEVYDALSESTFNLRTILMWTINDFPAYANLSGWSTKGKLACPWYQSEVTMLTNKERIERVEVEIGSLQDGMKRMELGLTDRLHRLEETMSKLEATNEQKVSLASFHLEGEANQWWQWMRRTYQEEEKIVTWESFVEELWARFGPTECEDYDEALSRVKQTGSLRDYQREFERLGNRVHGWTQKALVGTFMGGLKPEILEEIRMFRPKTLKEAISLAQSQPIQKSLSMPSLDGQPQEPCGSRQRIFGVSGKRRNAIIQGKIQTGSGLDMVLGVQWFEMLGSMVCNWKQLTMDFTWENKSCRLQGIGPQSIQMASLTEITKELRQGQSGFAICFHVNVEDFLNTTTPDMQDLLKEYNTLFQEPTKLPSRREINHNITLKEGTEPVNVRPYRYAYFQKAEIEKQVQEMLNSGLIRPIDDMLDELHGEAYFTKLDLRAGYHQAIKNSIFRPYLRKFILIFFDDILIYSPSWRSHLTHVKQAMEVLKQHQFFLKASKCTFGQQELEYLGHIITSHGVKVDETKIAAMVSWPQSKHISELRGFLGLMGYYRKFVQGYGVLARPLTNLLKKGQFEWNAEADKAFIN